MFGGCHLLVVVPPPNLLYAHYISSFDYRDISYSTFVDIAVV
jgi:hypothetical protein